MKTKTINKVGFDEIFHHAEKPPFNIGWNDCNDIFFNGVFTYKSVDEIDLQSIESDYKFYTEQIQKDGGEPDEVLNSHDYENYRAWEVLIAFMKENNITEMTVDSR